MSKEIQGLNNYITYLKHRARFLRIADGAVQSNEYKYCMAMRRRIKEWGSHHSVFYQYLRRNIDLDGVVQFMGISKRTCQRIIKKQVVELIKFIEEQEEILSKKYPFAEYEVENVE